MKNVTFYVCITPIISENCSFLFLAGAIFSNKTLSPKTQSDLMAFNAVVDFINAKEIHGERFGFALTKQVEFVEEQDDLENMIKGMSLMVMIVFEWSECRDYNRPTILDINVDTLWMLLHF